MQGCERCASFLHDYLTQGFGKDHPLYEVANEKTIKQHIHTLIHSILQAQSTITEWILREVQGEVSMRTTLLYKPKDKKEEYQITYHVLKFKGLGFREKVKDTECVVAAYDLARRKKTDRGSRVEEDFLASLFVPLIETLFSIHNDHSQKHSANYFLEAKPKKKVVFQDEYDMLYS